MSSRTTLKGYFKTNFIPKESDFADLIDSALVQEEDGIRKQGKDPVALQAQDEQNGEQQVLYLQKSFSDDTATVWKFSLINQNTNIPASGLNIGNSTAVHSCLFIKENDGNIGIGTTSPGAKLDVNGIGWFRNNPGGGLPATAGQGVKITTENNVGNLFAYDYAALAPLSLVLQGAGGNVGIGSQNPINKLEVNGAIHTNGNPIFFRQSTADKYDFIQWSGISGGDQVDIAGYNGVKLGYSSAAGGGKMTNVLVVSSNGNVGLGGTTNPRARMDIGLLNAGQLGAVLGRLPEGDDAGDGTFLGVKGYATQGRGDIKSFAIEHSFYGQINSSINFLRGPDTTGGFITFNTNTNIEHARIDSAGNMNLSGNYNHYSDVRIKQNIAQSNGIQDLNTINKLRVKEYFIKDKGTSSLQKGFIAQEVEEILPEAITTQSNYVPDIFSHAEAAVINNGALVITTKDNHRLKTGDIVRLITPSGHKEEKITAISDTMFSVDNWEGDASDIFVYGKKVDDFRTLNYNAIFTLGISAIQELYKQLQQLKDELKAIKERTSYAFSPTM